ncbi:DUF4381 domain-containing protein [Alteromonas gilva]|uniref:DUF4381 domain-containing protein n=1 Tax=Alteromonas gilva TaxID=2987522 RepID=A0ABT5L3H1_9ALTE|nr:DUF4381 domain-containing protein [Alteromonas gilva]MDC8831580.1 DUF4381 domain-containing protein [Alteromonas gilva]
MDPLAQLNDIQTPQGVDWWPLAWGWWVILAVLLALLIALVYLTVKHVRFNRARRDAIAMHQQLPKDASYPAQANQLLKRVTLHYYPAIDSAASYGQRWQHFLQHCLSEKRREKTAQGLAVLAQSPYQPLPADEQEIEQMYRAVSDWLKHARLKQAPGVTNEQEAANHV